MNQDEIDMSDKGINAALLFFLIMLLTSCGGPDMDRSRNSRIKSLETYLDAQIAQSVTPGIQYVVVDKNQVLFDYSGGWADIDGGRAISPDTTMMACSMTKTLTAVAIMQLVEYGALSLDDKLDQYIDISPYGSEISVRHLLSHTSGIPNPIPLKWAHLVESHETFDENAALENILAKYSELDFDPGTKYSYSNISYWLLGKVIEQISGQQYTEYMMSNVLEPLNLSPEEMNFTIVDSDNHAKGYLAKWSFLNLIKGFIIEDETIGEYEDRWLHIENLYLNGPAFGGLIGSARGFSKFLQDQLKNESVLFSSDTQNQFISQQMNNERNLVEMTLGWHFGESDGIPYLFKEGGGGGYHSEMRIYPEHGIGSVLMVNRTSFNTKKYLNRLDQVFVQSSTASE